jgi:hypothetical protein
MAILTVTGTAVNLTVKSKRDVQPPPETTTTVTVSEDKDASRDVDSTMRDSTRELSESTVALPNPIPADSSQKKGETESLGQYLHPD